MDLKAQIKNFFKGEVLNDQKTLEEYSHDASIFKISPKLVVFPKDTLDIRYLVNFVREHPDLNLSLTARAAGTDMSGGPLTNSIVVEFTKYFNHLNLIGNGYALTEPGIYYRDFEKQTLRHGFLMPAYPSSREICAVGGMAANNAGGEKTLEWGKVEDYVMALKVVLSDGYEYEFSPLNKDQLNQKLKQEDFEGAIYRDIFKLVVKNRQLLKEAKPKVSKNSSGYFLWNVWDGETFDLTKLFVGSQGTLGIITQIKFRLIKPEKHSQMLVIMLDDLKDLVAIVHTVLAHHPESFETFDDLTLKYAIQNLKELSKILKFHHFVRFIWELLPEFKLSLQKKLPKLVLIAEFTGDSQEKVKDQALKAQSDLKSYPVLTKLTKNSHEAQKYWVIRRQSFALLRNHSKNLYASPFIDDIIVKPESLPEFLPKLNELLSHYTDKLIYTLAGHIGNGNFHIIPLMNLKDPQAPEIIKEVCQKVFDLVFKYGGSMSGEHNDGMIRTAFVEKMYGREVYKLFEEVKTIFDPDNLFNPGKKVSANLEENLKHLNKE